MGILVFVFPSILRNFQKIAQIIVVLRTMIEITHYLTTEMMYILFKIGEL